MKVRLGVRSIVYGVTALGVVAVLSGPGARYLHSVAHVANSVVGTLDTYNAKTRVLTVETGAGRKSFLLPPRTSVRRGSRLVHADQLQHFIGARIKIRYTESSGVSTVESVMLSDDETPPSQSN